MTNLDIQTLVWLNGYLFLGAITSCVPSLVLFEFTLFTASSLGFTGFNCKMMSWDDGDGRYLRSCCAFSLPPEGQYGVGNLFMPRQENRDLALDSLTQD